MAIKNNNIIHCKTLQNLPKLGFLVHLATLQWRDEKKIIMFL
jgi:hypothetical protein